MHASILAAHSGGRTQDGGWGSYERSADGKLFGDRVKFSNGMKALGGTTNVLLLPSTRANRA